MSSNAALHALLASVAFVGCYLPDARPDAGQTAPDAGAQVASSNGVPCEVEQVLSRRCATCHGSQPVAPMSLTSSQDFGRAAPSAPARSVSDVTRERLVDAQRPMPPSGPLPEAELAVLDGWLRAGRPDGARCVSLTDGGIVSASDAGTVDAGRPGEGLPCEVEALLLRNCRSCHGANPSGPMSLLTLQQLRAPSVSEPATTAGALSVRRMRLATAPMPPGGALPASEVDVLSSWVANGMPAATCSSPVDAGVDPFAAAPVCTSGTYWVLASDEGSQFMNPGRACLGCHQAENLRDGREKAPEGIVGTVYPTAHEPTLCNGLPGGAVVVLTGADGAEFRLPVNSVGNFWQYSNPFLVKPYRARVETAAGVRRMGAAQTSGDCNSCHTQAGVNGAPGRILAP
jgi:mono/diheme cytochrome c family protein